MVLALDRVREADDRGRVFPLQLGEEAQLYIRRGCPRLDRARPVRVVDRGPVVTLGRGVLAGVDFAIDQQRPDQGNRRDPADHEAGDGEAVAAPFGRRRLAPGVECKLTAPHAYDDTGGEEEDRTKAGDLPEPVEAGPDGDGERRRKQRRMEVPLRVESVPPGAESAPEHGSDQGEYQRSADD